MIQSSMGATTKVLLERWLQHRLAARRRSLRLGVARATLLMMASHTALSLAVGLALAALIGLDAFGFKVTAALSVGIPLVVLTPHVYVTLRLLRDLDVARDEAQRLAVTDELTQLSNRRHFVEQASLQVAQAQRQRVPLALAAIDVDHFKALNDSAGHEGGDAALRRLSALLRGSHRRYDLLARVGGDEFALLMPGADRTVALATLDRLRQAAAGERLPTLSIGVAMLGDGDDLDTLMRHADGALYAAKREGRNRVAVHVPGSGAGMSPLSRAPAASA
jgi:diguanylate cyclase (GGDEF)-like protein